MSGVGGPWISVAISVDGVAVDATRGPLYGRELPNRHGPRGQTTPVPQPKLSPLPMGWGHLLGRSLDVTLERKPGTRVDVAIAIIENGEPQWRSNLATAGLPAGELHPTSLTDTVPVGLYLAPARSDADALTEARVAARLTQFFEGFPPPVSFKPPPPAELHDYGEAALDAAARLSWVVGDERGALIYLPGFIIFLA